MFRKYLLLPVICLIAMATLAGPATAMDLGGHDRDGVVVGLNMGLGWNSLKATVPTLDGPQSGETGSQLDFSGGLNVGWARSDYFIASIGIYGWKESFYLRGDPLSLTTFHFMAELCWFPRGEGFWLKGGIGAGNLDFYWSKIPVIVHTQSSGMNYTLGTGYEFRVADTAAVGLAYDYRNLGVGEFEGLQDTTVYSHNATLSLRFYMD